MEASPLMEIFAYGLEAKVGARSLNELNLQALPDQLPYRAGRRMLIYHGGPNEIPRAYLDGFDWVLCISSHGFPPPLVREGGRLRLLDWGMTDSHDLSAQPRWKQDRFTRFVEAVLQSHEEPPWSILVAPVPPEHIVACYLCSLAGIPPEGQWKTGFEEEVSYWAHERKAAPALNWNDNDQTDGHKLRQFLVEIGELEKSDQSQACDASL
jgi:hypothetical protein